MELIRLGGISGDGKFAIIDDEDIECVSKFNWWLSRGYARARVPSSDEKQHSISMHRLIMDFPTKSIDHINRNPLDNRKCNLRLCTMSENLANSKPQLDRRFKGVFKNRCKFKAQTKYHGKTINFGTYATAEEAAKAYNLGAKELFGEFAYVNQI